jgi:hypothetical protein
MALDVGLAQYGCGLVVAGVAPAWWHHHIQKFVSKPWSPPNILGEKKEFAKINVEETTSVNFAHKSIFKRHLNFFVLQSSENSIPNVEQVAEVGVYVEGIPRMVNSVMRWGEHPRL